jgi:predicted SnoaL-like aldol condensation-catalyzing enzyme
MGAKETVLAAAAELFGDKDATAVDRWVAADYRQHSALAPDGPEGLRGLVATLPDGFRYEGARVIADGDLVALDADGRLAEHWDALTPLVAQTASGRSQTDGPGAPTDLGQTEANRKLVAEFAERVLKGADYSVLTEYISTETYHQHNPEAADGLDGFGAAAAKWAEQGRNLVYTTIHKVVAEGDLVLVQSEGEFGGPVAYWDLFRVQDGLIVEHWDVIVPIPAELPHDNGLF